jgi:hypothetical protein
MRFSSGAAMLAGRCQARTRRFGLRLTLPGHSLLLNPLRLQYNAKVARSYQIDTRTFEMADADLSDPNVSNPPSSGGFIGQTCAYFRDFLDTDFRRQRMPMEARLGRNGGAVLKVCETRAVQERRAILHLRRLGHARLLVPNLNKATDARLPCCVHHTLVRRSPITNGSSNFGAAGMH